MLYSTTPSPTHTVQFAGDLSSGRARRSHSSIWIVSSRQTWKHSFTPAAPKYRPVSDAIVLGRKIILDTTMRRAFAGPWPNMAPVASSPKNIFYSPALFCFGERPARAEPREIS